MRRSQCAKFASTSAPCTCEEPEELLILAHGLQGAVADFSYLLDTLDVAEPAGRLLVHASAVNTDRTHDGIVAGGERLAADVRAIVAEHPTLTRISIVGFSLGGLYARYAVAALYDANERTVASLKPERFVAVAAPHLGVRNFGVYRFLPAPMLSRANLVCGDTGLQLVLEDGALPLLVRMTIDEELPFVSSLKAFTSRVLYANTRNDFMVNYGTAALDHSVTEISASDATVAVASPRDADIVDLAHDDRGCRVCFTFDYQPTAVPMPTVQRVLQSSPTVPTPPGRNSVTQGDEERVMANRLRSVGWSVVAVEFPTALNLPIAHNRIVAMSRGPIHTWMNAAGRRVVHHLVDTLVCGFDDVTPTFERVHQLAPRRSLSLRGFVPDM